MAQQLKVITQKKKNSFKKKISLNKKTLAESNTEREEHGIANEERNEIVIPQPILAHIHTDEERSSGTTLITGDSMIAGLREAKPSSKKKIKVRFFPRAETEDLMFHLISNLKESPTTSLFILGCMMRHMKSSI